MFAIFYRGVLDGAILNIPENADRVYVETPFSVTAYTLVGNSVPFALEFCEDVVMERPKSTVSMPVAQWFQQPGSKHTAQILDGKRKTLTFVDKSSSIV